MGDSVSGFDASKYMYEGNNSNTNSSSSNQKLYDDKIETFDFFATTNENNNDKNDTPANIYVNKEFLENYFSKYGDVNNDGVVDGKDATEIQNVLIGKTNGSYDIDGDGQTTVKDSTILQKYINGDEISGSDLNITTNKQIDAVLVTMNETVSDEDIKNTLANMSQDEYTQYVKELKLQYDEQIAAAKRNKELTQARYKDTMDTIKASLNKIVGLQYGTPILASDEDVKKELGMTRAEAQSLLDAMKADIDSYDSTISQLEAKKNNCDYYGLVFTKGYADYSASITDEDKSIFNRSALVQETFNTYVKSYSYKQYETASKNNGRKPMNPLQFYECVSKVPLTNPSETHDSGLKDKDVFQAMSYLKESAPDYYKTYCYLYDQDPEKAEQYVTNIKDELFQVYGQYLASNQLKTLYVKDGENDAIEVVANSLNMSANGLVNGMVKFAEGGVYSLEALAVCLGYDGTTQMSAYEYANLYKVYALMPTEEKEKMGLIKKNPATGEYENAVDNPFIDYTLEYSGERLDKVYQVSEGFGNTLPAIAISMINPTAGTVALGVSAGGNAYHGSMLEGNGEFASIMYGVFTGVSSALLEKKLGGLTGLSDVQITSAKTYFQSIAKEVAADQVTALADDLYRAEFMGDEFPTTEEGWAAYFENKKNMAIESAVTAGIMNAPALGTSVYKKRNFKNETAKLGLTSADIDDAISSYRRSNDAFANMTDDELIVNHGNQILNNARKNLNVDGGQNSLFTHRGKKTNDEYGGDQGSLIDRYKKKFKSSDEKLAIQEIVDVIMKDHPEFTAKDVEVLLTNLNQGGCTYVSTTNMIFEQFGYDNDAFRSYFGFDMYDSKGKLNHDRLVADIYSYLSDKVEFKSTGQYKTYDFSSATEAAQKLLGQKFSSEGEAIVALLDHGYNADGKTADGRLVYKKFEKSNQVVFGTPSEVAYQLTGEKVEISSAAELKRYLDSKGVGGNFSLNSDNSSKFFGWEEDGFGKWMNRYFEDRGINLTANGFEIKHNGSYDQLVSNVDLMTQNGYSVNVSTRATEKISMTNGTRLGWTTLGGPGQTAGHAMTFRGFDTDGNIIVSSWGELYTIPKMYFDKLDFTAVKVE